MSASSGNGDDLNLTPFLDLFSTLICFLLLTAVWFQVESLSTNVENVTSSDQPANPEDTKKKVQLVVTILEKEIQMAEDDKSRRFHLVTDDKGEIILDQIKEALAKWRQSYPDRKDIVLNTENTVPYKHMINMFDMMVGEGWPDVGVNTQ